MSTVTNPWEMKVGGRSTSLCPKGRKAGVIVAVIDVGTHPHTVERKVIENGEEITKKEVADRRELVLVTELAVKDPEGNPFIFANKYTWSLHKQANFRNVASTILGRQFNTGDRLDPRELLGKAVYPQIKHTNFVKNGETKTYANLVQFMDQEDDDKTPTATLPSFVWSVATGEPFPDHEWLPFVYGQSIKSIAESSYEARGGKAAVQRETPAQFATTNGAVNLPPSNYQQMPSVNEDDVAPF
jgi:hypothetical protein